MTDNSDSNSNSDGNKSKEFDKYSGNFEKTDLVKNVKNFHTSVKGYFIDKYAHSANHVIDVGSGRGIDIIYWINSKIKNVIGIEPSSESISRAIKRYVNLNRNLERNDKIYVKFVNGVGNKSWINGDAALSNKEQFISAFKNKEHSIDIINLFWTIHYMMDTEEDFKNIFKNIDTFIKPGGKVIIMCMDGKKIHNQFKKNNGVYDVRTKDNEGVFKLSSHYNHNIDKLEPCGNKIGVFFRGTYGLEKEIFENIVIPKFLIHHFEKNNYKLILNQNYLDIDIPELKSLTDYERKISLMYMTLIFEKLK
jgi:SAM-dependent methyltransferase